MFAVDLALIALSVRTGYLVDAFAIQDTNSDRGWNQLLRDLCQRISMFKDVVHVYDPSSDQSFFLNISLFLPRARGCLSVNEPGFRPTSFIPLSSEAASNSSLSVVPEEVLAVLRHLIIQIQLISAEGSVQEAQTITLPPDLPCNVTVPLAGFLLEFPVAFCPISVPGIETRSFLNQVPLRVYRCLLNHEDKSRITRDSDTTSQQIHRHLLMQFSIPSDLESTHPETYSPSAISAHLQETFSSRLEKAFAGRTFPSLTITHSVRTLDRVAL